MVSGAVACACFQSPYAKVQLVNLVSSPNREGGITISNASRRMGQGRTQGRTGCSNPEWHNYLQLGRVSESESEGDNYLLIQIYDNSWEGAGRDRFEDTCVASGRVLLHDVPDDGIGRPYLLTRFDQSSTDPYPPCPQEVPSDRKTQHPVIILRRLAANTPARPRMILCLIRHGESEWNEAKSARNLYKMVRSFDHPLSALGVKQANSLRQAWTRDVDSVLVEAEAEVSQTSTEQDRHAAVIHAAQRMYASPLTRALQTAMIGFMGHPCVNNSGPGISLLCSAREVKTLVGFDTVGIATGPSVKARACQQLQRYLAEDELDALRSTKLCLDEVNSKWWTSVVDTSETVNCRIRELLLRVRYDTCTDVDATEAPVVAVVVAHSMIIREVIRYCTVEGSRFASTELSQQLVAGKLENGGAVALELQFADHHHANRARALPQVMAGSSTRPPPLAQIENATLLFGTRLKFSGGSSDGAAFASAKATQAKRRQQQQQQQQPDQPVFGSAEEQRQIDVFRRDHAELIGEGLPPQWPGCCLRFCAFDAALAARWLGRYRDWRTCREVEMLGSPLNGGVRRPLLPCWRPF
jgi:broad specificity phosphatase PhoE